MISPGSRVGYLGRPPPPRQFPEWQGACFYGYVLDWLYWTWPTRQAKEVVYVVLEYVVCVVVIWAVATCSLGLNGVHSASGGIPAAEVFRR
jgi:hypothetical protein